MPFSMSYWFSMFMRLEADKAAFLATGASALTGSGAGDSVVRRAEEPADTCFVRGILEGRLVLLTTGGFSVGWSC